MEIVRLARLQRSLVVAVLLASGLVVAGRQAQQRSLPEKLTDADVWTLVSDIADTDGYFPMTGNFSSNEGEIGLIFPMIRQSGPKGGVYIGVGPEQNFTYIAAVHPAMAFVIDIRRQAVVQHLMFKAVFELSKDR